MLQYPPITEPSHPNKTDTDAAARLWKKAILGASTAAAAAAAWEMVGWCGVAAINLLAHRLLLPA